MAQKLDMPRHELDLRPRGRLLPILAVALISAFVLTTYQVSFGALIFSGDLAPYLSNGIGFCMMGVVLIGAIEALLSGSPGLIANPTVGSAIIIATMAAGIAGELSATPEKLFPTVTAAITIASLLTGAAFLALGWFRLGNLIRYIPYPVIGGFLAGTGWLVFTGALKTMNGVPLSLANLARFAQSAALVRWLPGLLLGVTLLALTRRFKHYLIMPLTILGAVLLFYAVLWSTGTPVEQARQLGLLSQPFPPGNLWQPPPLGELAAVDWGAIARQAGGNATLVLISTITLLLYASGIEVSTGVEIDLNGELRACGAGNLAAAFSASPPGYTIITMSVLSHKLGANSRLVGLLVAALCAALIFFGGSLIAMIPKPVLGGMLISVALGFLVDWLVAGWRKLSRADYSIVVIILLVMSGFGLLPGLAAGIALAAALFIVQYSQVPVVRHTFSGRSYHSRVQRSFPHAQLLRQEGKALVILELQGYVFFGTANSVYEQLEERLARAQAEDLPRVVMLDLRRVSGVDASAALSFVRLKRLLRSHQVLLAFSHLSPEIEQQLRRDVLTPGDRHTWRVFPDTDHGVEWFEEQVLHGEAGQQAAVQAQPGAVQPGQELGGLALLFAALGDEAGASSNEQSETFQRSNVTTLQRSSDEEALLRLLGYLDREELEPGRTLIQQGDWQQNLYFLDAGLLHVAYRTDQDRQLRLAAYGPGTIVGELGLYLAAPASATVTAAGPATVYRLSRENLQRLEREDPVTAARLHRFLLKRVGQRLLGALELVDALSD